MQTAPNILLVDDEEDILEFLQYNLTKNNYNTDIAKNGEEALELTHQNKYDLIILDVMMPGMDGVEVCRKIREKDINKEYSNCVFECKK